MVNSLYQVRFVKHLGEGYSSQQFEPRLIGANTLKTPPSAYGQRYYGYGHGHGHGQGHGYGLILEPLLRPRMNHMGVEQLQSFEVGLQLSRFSYMSGRSPMDQTSSDQASEYMASTHPSDRSSRTSQDQGSQRPQWGGGNGEKIEVQRDHSNLGRAESQQPPTISRLRLNIIVFGYLLLSPAAN